MTYTITGQRFLTICTVPAICFAWHLSARTAAAQQHALRNPYGLIGCRPNAPEPSR
jgi:hypothetical protein